MVRKTIRPTFLDTRRKVEQAVRLLMEAGGLKGEWGTEDLFDIIYEAVMSVAENWHIVDESHEEGLGYDVNALLSDALVTSLSKRQPSIASRELCTDIRHQIGLLVERHGGYPFHNSSSDRAMVLNSLYSIVSEPLMERVETRSA